MKPDCAMVAVKSPASTPKASRQKIMLVTPSRCPAS